MCLVTNEKKYTSFAGNFEHHADAPLRFGAHCGIEHNQGFWRSHWTFPSGDYSHRIAPARPPWSSTAATQQAQLKKLLASNEATFLLVKVMIFITQNGPPTQLIDAQCASQYWDNTIVAEEQS